MPLNQPVALVTGAGRNIGREIALALRGSGHAVAVNVRTSVAEGQAVVDEITAAGGQALLCVADVADQSAVQAMVDQITAHWGRLDVLVNNAAVRREAPLAQLSAKDCTTRWAWCWTAPSSAAWRHCPGCRLQRRPAWSTSVV